MRHLIHPSDSLETMQMKATAAFTECYKRNHERLAHEELYGNMSDIVRAALLHALILSRLLDTKDCVWCGRPTLTEECEACEQKQKDEGAFGG